MTFKCFVHNFSTEIPSEWDSHHQSESHTTSGSAPCKLCGRTTDFTFTGKRKFNSIPSICSECKESL